MRSARIVPPARPVKRPRLLATGGGGGSLLVIVFLLAACAGGDAQDARRGQREDAAAGATVPALQATFTAQRYFPPTPTPAPTRPPATSLSSLVLTLGLGAGDEPTDEYAGVPTTAGTAFAGALLHGLQPGQIVSAAWTNADGAVVTTSRFDVTAAADRRWVPLPLYLDGGLPPGDYAVHVYVDERPLNSLVFRLLPAGSEPQRLADLPPADQIRIQLGGPNQTPTTGGDQVDDGQRTDQGQFPVDGQTPPADQFPDAGQLAPDGQQSIVPIVTQTP